MTKVNTGIPPPMEDFTFQMTKVYSAISPPPRRIALPEDITHFIVAEHCIGNGV